MYREQDYRPEKPYQLHRWRYRIDKWFANHTKIVHLTFKVTVLSMVAFILGMMIYAVATVHQPPGERNSVYQESSSDGDRAR